MEVHEKKSLFELLLEHFSLAVIEPNLYVLISSRLSMEIFLGRKAARMAPRVLSLRLISYCKAEQFQGSVMLWMWW